MGFKPGQPRPANAGRKIGSKNKKTIVKAAVILAEKDLNPADEILKFIPTLTPKDQVLAWQYLHSFTESKPKQIDLPENLDFEDDTEISTDNLIKLAKS